MSYDNTPNRTVQVEGNTSPPGQLWQTLDTVDNSSVRNYFDDIVATNKRRMYRLRLD